MDLTTYLPAVTQRGLLTWQQAVAAGLDPREIADLVAAGHWIRIRKGVYADRASWDGLDPFTEQPVLRIHAAALVLRVPHVFSHDSAAILLGMGCPDARTALVHVTRPDVLGGRIRAGIKHHGAAYDAAEVVVVDGLRLLNPARTALDIAREHGRDSGMAACDKALRGGVTRTQLGGVLARMHHWPGVRAARAAVDLADAGAESWTESLARGLVVDLGIGRPETQFGLSDGGRTVWCDLRVGRHVFEVDGRVKYADADGRPGADTLWEEKKRQDFITGFKLGVSRLTFPDLHSNRRAAKARILREYLDTTARFGTDIADLAPYVVRGRGLSAWNM